MTERHEYDGTKDREGKKAPVILWAICTLIVICGAIFMGYYLFRGRENVAVGNARDSQPPASYKGGEAAGTGAASGGETIEERVAAGKKLFGSLCVGCHGKDARGGVCPDLTVSTFKYGKSRSNVTKTITEGRPGGMPTFGGRIEKAQIESLVEFVLSLK